MSKIRVGFLGCGNMGKALLRGLASSQSQFSFFICDRHPDRLTELAKHYPIHFCDQLPETLDWIILAVKPKDIPYACHLLQQKKIHSQYLISLAAGISHATLQSAAEGIAQHIIRIMPNLPVAVLQGITGIFAPTLSQPAYENFSEHFKKMGTVFNIVQEKQLSAFTALAGSGPGFFYAYLDAYQKAAISLGFSETEAQALTESVALGAIDLAKERQLSWKALKQEVTSAGGTTSAGLNILETHRFDDIISSMLKAATQRSVSLERDKNDH